MTNEEQAAYINLVREKRTQTLIGVWKALLEGGKLDANSLQLSDALVNEVVEYYLSDLMILKQRYKISDTKIQLHKIAGLMTAAILRFRPIIPKSSEFKSVYELCANEILAVFQGIAICGEYTAQNGHLDILKEDWFEPWVKDFCTSFITVTILLNR